MHRYRRGQHQHHVRDGHSGPQLAGRTRAGHQGREQLQQQPRVRVGHQDRDLALGRRPDADAETGDGPDGPSGRLAGHLARHRTAERTGCRTVRRPGQAGRRRLVPRGAERAARPDRVRRTLLGHPPQLLGVPERLRRQQPPGPGGHRARQIAGQRLPGARAAVQRVAGLGGQPGDLLGSDPLDQHLLAREAPVHRAHADPGPPRHLLHRRAVAELAEHLTSRAQHALEVPPRVDPQPGARARPAALCRLAAPVRDGRVRRPRWTGGLGRAALLRHHALAGVCRTR